MNKNSKLNKAYELYVSEKYQEAFILIEEILKVDPQNVYALKYKEVILPHLNKKSEVGKISTVKAKGVKCPHCQAPIAMSSLNEEQKTRIRNNDYSNLNLKCPYCHTTFTLQKKVSESIIGIKIGDKINYEGKNYRTVGSVTYEGIWIEGGEKGKLNYIEWILLGEDNSYIYFSEGYFIDGLERKFEYEFSKKIIPNFEIELTNENLLHINGKKKNISELNIITAKMAYGENSKVFKVGEEIKLFEFSHQGKKYVLEKEKSGIQKEAGIYETKAVSVKDACKIFGKEVPEYTKIDKLVKIILFGSIGFQFLELFKILEVEINYYLISFIAFSIFIILSGVLLIFIYKDKTKYDDKFSKIFTLLIIGFVSIVLIYVLIEVYLNYFLYLLGIIALGILAYLVYKFDIYKTKLFYALFVGPIFGFLIVPFTFSAMFDSKDQITLEEINKSRKYEIEFTNSGLIDKQVVSTEEFGTGGTKTTYKETTGLKFSVLSKEDLEIIENLQNNFESSDQKIQDIFSNENIIYKVK